MSNQSLREAAQQALEALRKSMQGSLMFDEAMLSFQALKEALAQPETGASCDHDKAQPVAEERPHWAGTMEGSGIAAWDENQVNELVRKVNLWKEAFWQERAKFQAETLRNSLISAAPQPPAEHGAELSDERIKEVWADVLGCVISRSEISAIRTIIAADRAARGGAA